MWVQGDKKHLKNIPKNKEGSHSRLTRSLTAKSIHKKTHHHECGQKCSSCSEDSDTLIQGHFVGLTVFIPLLIHRHICDDYCDEYGLVSYSFVSQNYEKHTLL